MGLRNVVLIWTWKTLGARAVSAEANMVIHEGREGGPWPDRQGTVEAERMDSCTVQRRVPHASHTSAALLPHECDEYSSSRLLCLTSSDLQVFAGSSSQ
jgi:hypothetical protein